MEKSLKNIRRRPKTGGRVHAATHRAAPGLPAAATATRTARDGRAPRAPRLLMRSYDRDWVQIGGMGRKWRWSGRDDCGAGLDPDGLHSDCAARLLNGK